MAQSFTLYGHFLSGPSVKVGLMLRLCRQPFAFRLVDLRAGAHRQPDYLRLNRFGQVPALVHGGRSFCQSNGILEYLAETLDRFGGADAAARAAVRAWLYWDFDRLSPGIFRSRAAARGIMSFDPAVLAFFRQAGEAGLAELDRALADQPFLAGAEPTIADIACHVVAAYAPEAGLDLAPHANLRAWAARMAALPGARPVTEVLPQSDAEVA
jgi:glutathione S-transferase